MIHIQVFETNSEYMSYTSNNTSLDSGVLYYIKEDNTAHYYTNNIEGIPKVYNFGSNASDTKIILSDQQFGWTESSASATQTGTFVGPTLTNLYSLPVNYSSSNTNVATVSNTGEVNVIANGTATITASFEGNENYYPKSVNYVLDVAIQSDLESQELSFSSESATVTSASNVQVPTITNAYNLPLTYSSSNTSVATVDQNGQVTIVGNGTATITASFEGNNNYKPKTISYTLNVAIPQELSNNEFKWTNDTVTVTQSGAYSGNPLVNTHNLPVTYSSSDTNCVQINSSGQVNVILNIGQVVATITALFEGNAQYKAKTVTYTMNIDVQADLESQELSFSSGSATVTSASNVQVPTITNAYNLPLTYSSSNTSVATVDSSGNVTIIGNGTATISASFAGDSSYNPKTISYTLTVAIPQTLSDAEFSWPINSINITNDITQTVSLINTHHLPVTYTSSNENVAIYGTGADIGSLYAVNDGTATITASFAGNAQYKPKTVSFTVVVDVQYDINNEDFKWSALSAKATATGSFNGPTLTNTNNLSPITYSSSDTNVATINSNGQVTVVANGNATISAIFAGDNYYNAKTVTYTLVVAIPQDLPANTFKWTYNEANVTEAGSYTGNPLINTLNLPVTFSSSDTSVATVDSNGVVTVIANGFTYIRAEFAGNDQYKPTGRAYPLSVAIPQQLSNNEFAWSANSASATQAGTLTGGPTLINTHNLPVSYISGNHGIATIDSNGQVTVVANGTVTIAASFAGNADYKSKTVYYTLTVAIPQQLTDNEFSWSASTATATQAGSFNGPTFTNTHNLSVWFESSNTSVVEVSTGLGGSNYPVINVISNGTAIVSARFNGNSEYVAKTVTYTLTVAIPNQLSNQEFGLSANSAQITSTSDIQVPVLTNTHNLPVTYSSSDTTVATVNANGEITPVGNGTTTISVIFAGNAQYAAKTVTYTLTVAIPQELSYNDFSWTDSTGQYSVVSGASVPTLTNNLNLPVTYSSSNTSIATIDSNGTITPVDNGDTTISAIFAGNAQYKPKTVTYILTVNDIKYNLTDQEFSWSNNSGQVTPTSSTKLPTLTNTHDLVVTYSSSNTSIATIDSWGTITPVDNGTTTISAIFSGDNTYNAKTVTYTLTVSGVKYNLTNQEFSWTDTTGQYSATSGANVPTLTNTHNLTVSYSSSNTSIATIDSSGTITPVANGTTTISAIFNGDSTYNPKIVTYTLTVKDVKANLTDQEFSWNSNSGEAGSSSVRVPVLINTHNLPVSYSSSNTNVATIDSNNNITLVANGTTIISAIFSGDNTYNPKTVTYTLTVSGIKQNLTDAQFGWDSAADPLWTWVAGDPYPHLAESRSKGTTTGIMLTNSLNLPVTFTSSNTNVALMGYSATFAEYWTLAGTNGSTLISATFAGNDTYNPKTVAYWLDVTLSKLSADISWSSNSAEITDASNIQVPTLNNPNNLTVTYSSSDTTVATVNANGEITPVGNGTTTISAIFAGNDAYNSSTVTYTLTVSLVRDLTNEEFAWSNGGAAVTSYQENGGVLSNAPTLINTNNLVVRYWSSDTDVARINNDTGVITLTGSGTTTISAIFVGNSNFNAKTISYDLTADISAHIITTSSNAPLMTIVRNNNWAANSDFMTQSEAEKVTNIGTVFRNKTNLTSFTEFQYFTNVTDVPYEAFSGCTNMASITLPSSITRLSSGAFALCSSLTSIVIPNSVTNDISSNIFSGCSSLANVTLSNNQTLITSSMFENCTSLTSITIPNSVSSIDANSAFTGCTNLVAINVGSGNSAYTSIDGVLYNKAVTILEAYPQGKQDTSYTIPNTVTKISYKIENNTYLTEVYIPSSVTNMTNSFSGCTNLVSVTVDIETPLTINKWTLTNRSNAYLYVPTGCSAAYQAADYWKEFLSIEETGTDYPSDALITMTDDPALMTAINNNNLIQHESQDYFTESEAAAVTNEQFVGTFWGNNDITAFNQLGYFTSLTTLPTLGSGDSRHGSFEQCLNLESVTLPPNITTFGSRTFAMTNSLTNIDMGYIIVEEGQGMLTNITSLGDSMFYQSNYPDVANFLNELSDSSITTIPEHCFAFVGTQNWSEITIPASVTGIGSFAFATVGSDSSLSNYNPWITTVEMGANIAQIDSYAFREQSALEKVIVHATTPPQIASNTFVDTNDSFIIYVPHASMNAYKTNSIKGWSTYADRIRSIEGDLPFD